MYALNVLLPALQQINFFLEIVIFTAQHTLSASATGKAC